MKFLKLVILFALTIVPAQGWAHCSKVDCMSQAVGVALDKFELESTGAQIRRFIAVRGFYDVLKLRVSIYLEEPNEEIRYVCQEDHGAGKWICRNENPNEDGR